MSRPNPLIGARGLWLRQFSDTAERTPERIIENMVNLAGANLWAQKCANGDALQGTIDRATNILVVSDVGRLASLAAASGVDLLPTVVPRMDAGLSDQEAEDWIDRQVSLHAAIGRETGTLLVDLEDGDPVHNKYYWDARNDLIPRYWQLLREAAPNVFIINQPDPREWAVAETHVLHPDVIASYDALCPQHYTGWSEMNWGDPWGEADRFQNLLVQSGKPGAVTLWGSSDWAMVQEFWGYVSQEHRPTLRAVGFICFAFGEMNARDLEHMRRLPDAKLPAPDPAPPEVPCQILLLRQGLAKIGVQFADIALNSEPLLGDALEALVGQATLVLDELKQSLVQHQESLSMP